MSPAEAGGERTAIFFSRRFELAWTNAFESIDVRAVLAKTGGNVTKAAEIAGVSRRFLQRMLARLGIRSGDETDE